MSWYEKMLSMFFKTIHLDVVGCIWPLCSQSVKWSKLSSSDIRSKKNKKKNSDTVKLIEFELVIFFAMDCILLLHWRNSDD